MNPDAERHAEVLWNFLKIGQPLEPVDVVIALGSNSTRVAGRAADIFLAGYGERLVLSGGNGRDSTLPEPEADVFARIAIARGVPENRLILEGLSSNLGENVTFTRERLADLGIAPRSAAVVSKPYLERRALAAFGKLWPELRCVPASPDISFQRYAPPGEARGRLANLLAGTFDRVRDYPALGFQLPQDIPPSAAQARAALASLGYAGY